MPRNGFNAAEVEALLAQGVDPKYPVYKPEPSTEPAKGSNPWGAKRAFPDPRQQLHHRLTQSQRAPWPTARTSGLNCGRWSRRRNSSRRLADLRVVKPSVHIVRVQRAPGMATEMGNIAVGLLHDASDSQNDLSAVPGLAIARGPVGNWHFTTSVPASRISIALGAISRGSKSSLHTIRHLSTSLIRRLLSRLARQPQNCIVPPALLTCCAPVVLFPLTSPSLPTCHTLSNSQIATLTVAASFKPPTCTSTSSSMPRGK